MDAIVHALPVPVTGSDQAPAGVPGGTGGQHDAAAAAWSPRLTGGGLVALAAGAARRHRRGGERPWTRRDHAPAARRRSGGPAVVGVTLLVAAFVRGTPEQHDRRRCGPATHRTARARAVRDTARRAPARSTRRRAGRAAGCAGPTADDPAPAALGRPAAAAVAGVPADPARAPAGGGQRRRARGPGGRGRAAALQLPDDADRVGWWRGGSRAGSPFGTAVVAGHLDSATDPAGFLAGLAGLVPGDLVDLASSEEQQRYRVVAQLPAPERRPVPPLRPVRAAPAPPAAADHLRRSVRPRAWPLPRQPHRRGGAGGAVSAQRTGAARRTTRWHSTASKR